MGTSVPAAAKPLEIGIRDYAGEARNTMVMCIVPKIGTNHIGWPPL
jgi:hypothetical protein